MGRGEEGSERGGRGGGRGEGSGGKGEGGPADWSISTPHDPLPSSCHSEKMLSIVRTMHVN